LDAERIHVEREGVTLVVEGIEIQADFVVAPDIFAFCHARADLAGLFLTEERGVEVLVVVCQPGDGFATGWLTIGRPVLPEIGDAREALDFAAGEKIVQLRRLRNPLDAH